TRTSGRSGSATSRRNWKSWPPSWSAPMRTGSTRWSGEGVVPPGGRDFRSLPRLRKSARRRGLSTTARVVVRNEKPVRAERNPFQGPVMGIYDRDYYRNEGPSFLGSITGTPAVCKWLIMINVAVFIVQLIDARGNPAAGGEFTRTFELNTGIAAW